MNSLIFIPSFFIFLYTIYKLVKDDHVFFRRNIKLEHFFDYTFIVSFICWFLLQFVNDGDGERLTYIILISSICLLLITRYKRIPIGRFFDFFALSFVSAIPLWYFFLGIFAKTPEKMIYIVSSIFYFFTGIFFMKVLYPKVMSRTLKEGSISALFLMLYSFFSLLISVFHIFFNKANVLSVGNIIIILMLFASMPLLIKIQK